MRRKHSVLIYFGLVFLFSWGGLLILAPGDFPPSAERFASLGPMVYLAIIAGPSVAGILMIVLTDGIPGIRELLARLGHWRVSPRAYALALLPGSGDHRNDAAAINDLLRIPPRHPCRGE